MVNWEQEAKKQAAVAGEFRITLAKRRSEITDRMIGKRMRIRRHYRGEEENSKVVIEVLTSDLQDEADWIAGLLGDRHE